MQSNAFQRRVVEEQYIHRRTKHLYAHATVVLIVIIFIMGPERGGGGGGGGGGDPDPLAGSALACGSIASSLYGLNELKMQ